MDFSLSNEQHLIKKSVTELASQYDVEYWRKKDLGGERPDEFLQHLAKDGWLSICLPEEYGGAGLGLLEASMVIEAATSQGGGTGVGVFLLRIFSFGSVVLLRRGSKTQKEAFLEKIGKGQLDFALSLTEPNAGTNTLGMRTHAERVGNEFVINGEKVFTSGLDRADYVVVAARTTPLDKAPKRTFGITLFILPANDPAIKFKPIPLVGHRMESTFEVQYQNVHVREENVLGEVDHGWDCLLDILNPERICTCAMCVGTGDRVLKLAVDYACSRTVFESPIGSYQSIQHPLADAYSHLEVARLMNYKAAWLFDKRKPCGEAANIAKLRGAEAAWAACDCAMQTFGGYGYTNEVEIERHWRDLRLYKIAPVSQQMALNFIGEHVLNLPKSYR